MSGIGTLILIAAVMFCVFGGITLLAHIYNLNNIKSKTVGDGQHGTARWATKSEIRKTYRHITFTPKKWRSQAAKGEMPTVSRITNHRFFKKKKEEPEEALPQGIVVGCSGGKFGTTALIDTGDVHVLMIGAAGVGKTAFWLYPCIEYACASGMSFLSTDTKGDVMRNYGNIAKQYGYHVSVIDLRNPTQSNGNNLLHLVNKYMDLYQSEKKLIYKAKSEKYAKIISKTIILSGMDAASFGQNAYFYDAAEGLLTATILLVAEFCEPQKRHIVSVFKIIQELLAPSQKKGKNQFQQLIESHYDGTNGQSPYNVFHLDAMYDLLQHTYQDVALGGDREMNERRSLCSMVDRSNTQNAIVIADRGYENYNLMAHIQEKGWKFLIRIKDIHSVGGIASGLNLPDFPEFDTVINLSLTTKQTNEIKELCENSNEFRFIPSAVTFDFLPKTNRKFAPTVFYKLPFRIVRFKITDSTYETVVTNLDSIHFPATELKKLYAMRWGIETSFRELKYTIGLLHFHSKKVEFICQEIYAKLIMYNFTELITSHVIVQKLNTKYIYKANFTVAVHLCRQLFLGNISPPNLEALIRKNVSPVRPGRSRPRNLTTKYAVSFLYRVA